MTAMFALPVVGHGSGHIPGTFCTLYLSADRMSTIGNFDNDPKGTLRNKPTILFAPVDHP
jgi:hypothetical protein